MKRKELQKIEDLYDLLVEAYLKDKIDYTYWCWMVHILEDIYNPYWGITGQIFCAEDAKKIKRKQKTEN